MTLNDVILILTTAPRLGAERDNPEGTCYIRISATLADQMAQTITDTFNAVADQARIIQHTLDTAIANEMIHRAGLTGPGK